MTVQNLLIELRRIGVQIWPEGDQLRYRAPKGVLSAERLQQIKKFRAEIFQFYNKPLANSPVRAPIEQVERPTQLPLSAAQQRLWFLHRLDTSASAYNVPLSLRLTGQLDVLALQLAINDVVGRHESLRTLFPDVDGIPQQQVLEVADSRAHLILHQIHANETTL